MNPPSGSLPSLLLPGLALLLVGCGAADPSRTGADGPDTRCVLPEAWSGDLVTESGAGLAVDVQELAAAPHELLVLGRQVGTTEADFTGFTLLDGAVGARIPAAALRDGPGSGVRGIPVILPAEYPHPEILRAIHRAGGWQVMALGRSGEDEDGPWILWTAVLGEEGWREYRAMGLGDFQADPQSLMPLRVWHEEILASVMGKGRDYGWDGMLVRLGPDGLIGHRIPTRFAYLLPVGVEDGVWDAWWVAADRSLTSDGNSLFRGRLDPAREEPVVMEERLVRGGDEPVHHPRIGAGEDPAVGWVAPAESTANGWLLDPVFNGGARRLVGRDAAAVTPVRGPDPLRSEGWLVTRATSDTTTLTFHGSRLEPALADRSIPVPYTLPPLAARIGDDLVTLGFQLLAEDRRGVFTGVRTVITVQPGGCHSDGG